MTTMRVVVALAALTILCVASLQAAPQLMMQDTVYDFGYVPQNAHISHIFWLKSVGTDTLKIVKVTPGCGCTQAPIDKEMLAPKDSTRLEIIFNTGSYIGPVEKTPRVSFNDSIGEHIIHFRANVEQRPDSTFPLVISPYKLDISQFGEKPRTEIRFTIRNVTTQPLKTDLISYSSDYFQVELPKSIDAGKSADGMIRLSKDAAGKDFEKSFTFQLNDERQSRYTVPVKRTLRALQTSSTNITPAVPTSAH